MLALELQRSKAEPELRAELVTGWDGVRDGHAECGKGADGSGRRRLHTAPLRFLPFLLDCPTNDMYKVESLHRDCSANNRDTLCRSKEFW